MQKFSCPKTHFQTCENSDKQKLIFRYANTYVFWESNLKLYFGKRKNKSMKDSDVSYKNSETQECNKKYSQDKVYTHGLEKASAYSWLQNVSNSWKILVIGRWVGNYQQERTNFKTPRVQNSTKVFIPKAKQTIHSRIETVWWNLKEEKWIWPGLLEYPHWYEIRFSVLHVQSTCPTSSSNNILK